MLTGWCLTACLGAVLAHAEEMPDGSTCPEWSETSGNSLTSIAALRASALNHFKLADYDNAAPVLREALAATPADPELNAAMLEVLLAERDYPAARLLLDCQESLGLPGAALGRARIKLETGQRKQAIQELNAILSGAQGEVALQAADVLVEALLLDGQRNAAEAVARSAMASPSAPGYPVRYAHYDRQSLTRGELVFDTGYRLEYDDNVAYPDEESATGREDLRHVLMADIHYQRPLSNNWTLYAQGHAMQTLHTDLEQFDLTRVSGAVAAGHAGKRTGWKLPVEFIHDRLDGDTYRTTLAVVPGFFVHFGGDLFSHFYARFQSADYEQFVFAEDDRSGDVSGLGVLVAGSIGPSLQLRGYLEFNRHDTNGAWWQRDQALAYVQAEYEVGSGWTAGLAMRYEEEDYEHVRPVFADRQSDEATELYLNVTHSFRPQWRWRAQVSIVDHQSNLPIFDYDRNVYSLAIWREF